MKNQKAELLKLDNQLCFAVYTASRLITQAYDPLLTDLNLTYPQYLVMLILWERDAVSVKEIGELLKLDSGTLSPLLKKLQIKGYVNRTRSKEDERVVQISLTKKGDELRRSAVSVPEGLMCQININVKDIRELREKLNELIQNLS